jgi:hypothetical protein
LASVAGPEYWQLISTVPAAVIPVTVNWSVPRGHEVTPPEVVQTITDAMVTLVAVIANPGVEASAPTLKMLKLKARINPKRTNKRRLCIAIFFRRQAFPCLAG